ncbi:hypothetical protein [Halosegnis longus]|uniref:hypothetical protein n=1 Tax=Halosegnis longus TaxID=2216012 RepID=UPI0011CE1D5A
MCAAAGLQAGHTNLTCPRCHEQIDKLHLQPANGKIDPDMPLNCPYCREKFYAENALLYTYHSLNSDEYFGSPFSLGGGTVRNAATVNVGGTRRHPATSFLAEDQFDTIQILSAERSEASGDDRLPLERLGDSYTRVRLGDSVLVALLPVAPDKLVLTASFDGNNEDNAEIELGEELDVLYDANLTRQSVTNPPWIDLLREAEQAILRGNYISAIPLLVSAIDGGLYRVIYLYYLVDGLEPDEADEHIREEFGDDDGNVYTDDLAKDALKRITGETVSDALGPYGEDWDAFTGQEGYQGFRHNVIHPGREPFSTVNQETVIEWFNVSVSLILGGFELLWELDSDV